MMNKRAEKKTNTDAVSPVVGVMLMLVVTIIIAAIAGSFAGNLGGNAEKAPAAAIEAKIISNGGDDGNQYVMTFEHLGGDPIPTKDLKILTYYTEPSGKEHMNEHTSLDRSLDIFGDGKSVRVPYLADVSAGVPGDQAVDFGNFAFMTGDVLSTGSSLGTGGPWGRGLLGFDVTTPEKCKEVGFGRGSIVEVRLVHMPSEKVIFQKEVAVR